MNNEDTISRAYALGIIQHIQDDKAQTAPEKNILNFAFVGIKCAPSVPPQVVHGRWIEYGEEETWFYKCSCCGSVGHVNFRFCQDCGAKMGGRGRCG